MGGTEIISLFLVNPDGLPVAPPEIYEEETSSSFEVGFRSTLLNGNLQLNGAVFHTEVDDMQFFEFFVGPFGLLEPLKALTKSPYKALKLAPRGNSRTDSVSMRATAASMEKLMP